MNLPRKILYKSTPHLLDQTHERKQWLRKHGRAERITFSEQMVEKLAKYFNSLDQDGSKTISANELEDPLILFGLCKNRAEVQRIFRLMDIDNSGELDFKQFLQVFRRVATERRAQRQCKKVEIDATFQDFTKTLLGMQNKLEKGVSFRLGMSIYRRKNMLKAMMGKSLLQKQQGKEIMSKFQQQITSKPQGREKLKTARQTQHTELPKIEPRPLLSHRRVKTMA